MREEPFVGGNLSASVRIGDTVRRRTGPWTPAVHGLLRHLAACGFDGAPRVVGVDERGREVLSFVEGEVAVGWPDPYPAWVWSEECLVGAARLLRRYHDAVAGFMPPADARWRVIAPPPHEVICHNDAAPYNTVFRDHRPHALLDWDLAGPGSRAWDVARSAFTWVPLYARAPRGEPFTLEGRAARLARFCDAYGLERREGFVDTLVGQLHLIGGLVRREAESGDPGFRKLLDWDVPTALQADAEYLERHRAVLERALSGRGA